MNNNNSVFLTLLLLVMAFACTNSWGGDKKNQVVGRVTLIIGQASATNIQGQKRKLKKAGAVFVGDRIVTSVGAHVHIKFIDEGRVSIRPQSQLDIESYHYDSKVPENNSIRFYLQKGVLRSISGKATEAAHERYRMNTPIAALGVLGTDYIVSTNQQRTWAAVYTGAISLAPLHNGCNYGGYGACINATELTAKMNGMYLQVNAGDIAAQVKIRTGNVQYAQGDGDENGVLSRLSQSELGVVSGVSGSDRENDLASNEKLVISTVLAVANPVGLSWVRWPWQSARPDDAVSQSQAEGNEGEKVTIGNSYAGLFRAPSTLLQLQPRVGEFKFTLQNSHVVFIAKGQQWQNAAAASLNKANLQINFATRQFNTQLEIFHQQTGGVSLNVSGKVSNDGLFRGKNGADKVAGALTLDGNNAGLQFEKKLGNGSLQGITEWRR